MVWVHGGGFSAGSGGTEMYGPEFLLDHNIVLVTINYRVGMLG
jgi:acetylcholinesterase